jgi:signal transduction histidine kinase
VRLPEALGAHRGAVFDVSLAAVLTLLGLSLVFGTTDDTDRLVGSVLVILHVAPLAVRRRWPEAVLLAMVVTGLVFVSLGFVAVGLGPAIVIAVYTVAARCPRRRAAVVLLGTTSTMAVAVALSGSGPATVVANVAVFATAWLVGDGNRRATEAAAAERERAAELARTREQLARQAVVSERLRIARELHDIVAHSMSVIAVQAGTGRIMLDRSPDSARQSLVAIEETSRTALAEMRRLLDVLRDDTSQPLLVPNPGMGDLDALVAETVASGLPVHVRVEGDHVALPAGADLAAYRIVQEALTNVRRHAGASRVWVTVHYLPTEVAIEVTDDGSGHSAAGRVDNGGHGVIGMQERAELYGGRVEVGRRPGGGFAVAVRIPYDTAGA